MLPMKTPSFSSLGIAATLIFALIAELYRFHGYLLLDLFVPIFVATWLAVKLLRKQKIHLPQTVFPAALFAGLGIASLLLNSAEMTTTGFLSSAFYGVRFVSFYALSMIVANQKPNEKRQTFWALALFTLLLALTGFIQLKIQPDFTAFEDLGWDPHQNRLLSTWFDPNFVGGLFAFIIPLFLGIALDKKSLRKFLFPLVGLVSIALVLTLSRSAYLAFLIALFVFGFFRSIKLLAAFGIGLILLVAVLPSVQDRFVSLYENARSFFTETYTIPDASARLRFASWDEAWELFKEKPLLGHGYNRYKFAALQLGTLDDLEIHSASGSDSSLLNILATTGILGFFPFISLYVLLAIQAFKNRKKGFSLGFLAGLCGLFVHSIFVNSLLFPLFMAPFWISAGLIEKASSIQK